MSCPSHSPYFHLRIRLNVINNENLRHSVSCLLLKLSREANVVYSVQCTVLVREYRLGEGAGILESEHL